MGENIRHIDLDCGIAYERIERWLAEELGLIRLDSRKSAWMFSAPDGQCRISIDRLESRAFGDLHLERTRLRADGPEAGVDMFERLFTLRFISAGG